MDAQPWLETIEKIGETDHHMACLDRHVRYPSQYRGDPDTHQTPGLQTYRQTRRGNARIGERTLTDQVLPVSGIREKVIAARRIGIRELILPQANKGDDDELPDYIKEGFSVSFAKHYREVAKIVFGE